MSEQHSELKATKAAWVEPYLRYGRVIEAMVHNMQTQPSGPDARPIFHQRWHGDYRRTPSFYNAGVMVPQGLDRYSDKESIPPLARLVDNVHAELRKGTARLPMLDETALQPETVAAMREFSAIIKRYGEAVKATPDRYYASIPQPELDKYDREIVRVVKQLSESELATAMTVPVEMISPEGVAMTEQVPNVGLGIYLFALSFVPRMQVDLNRVPLQAKAFLEGGAGVTFTTLSREVDHFDLWAPDSLRNGVCQVFDHTNHAMETAFRDQQQALQLAHLVQGTLWQVPLQLLGLPPYPEALNTPLEAAIVMESMEEHHNKRHIKPIYTQLAQLRPEESPSRDVILSAKQNLSRLSGSRDATARFKVSLLRDYLNYEQEKLPPSAWGPLPGNLGRGRW